MSVTFSIQAKPEDVVNHEIHCYATTYGDHPDEGHGHKTFSTFEETAASYKAGLETGEVSRDCCKITMNLVHGEEHDINMSNSNATELLYRLGFQDFGIDGFIPLEGVVSPGSLRGRILIARAFIDFIDDEGTPSYESQEAGQARLVVTGRRSGYFAERYEQLEALCDIAERHDREIVWS